MVDADDLLLEMRSTARDISDELGKVDDFSEEDKAALARKVGHGALKYFLLKVAPAKSMMFDPKSSIDFFGNTAPFIQFNVVRCKSILRSVMVQDLAWSSDTPMDAAERTLRQACCPSLHRSRGGSDVRPLLDCQPLLRPHQGVL